jgi:molybdopterin-guanine dinucleotide biosynthesis protein A
MVGLVLAGGQSTRMKIDKALLVYKTKPQWQVVEDLLRPYCSSIYVNSSLNLPPNYSIITDSHIYKNIGPLAGILSLFDRVQEPIFVIAIDYPKLLASDIKTLHEKYDKVKQTTVMYNTDTNFYHPQIGIYTTAFLNEIKLEVEASQIYSLQTKLQEMKIDKLLLSDNLRLESIDTIEEYLVIKNNHGHTTS